MFKVGFVYKTKEGCEVLITHRKYAGTAYDCVRGSDGVWRYNRQSDMGRVTASAFDMSCPRNLEPA